MPGFFSDKLPDKFLEDCSSWLLQQSFSWELCPVLLHCWMTSTLHMPKSPAPCWSRKIGLPPSSMELLSLINPLDKSGQLPFPMQSLGYKTGLLVFLQHLPPSHCACWHGGLVDGRLGLVVACTAGWDWQPAVTCFCLHVSESRISTSVSQPCTSCFVSSGPWRVRKHTLTL